MNPFVRVDALLLAGAALQCTLVLASRRFRPQDWLLPLFILIGGSAGFFGFLRLCSADISTTADVAVVGFVMALGASAVFIAELAPPRLNPTALLSLTITFWAAYLMGDLSRVLLVPGLVMTLAVVLFAAGVWVSSMNARMALQAWSLVAGAALAADGVPARVAAMYKDYHTDETAAALLPLEVFVSGAQFFLVALMAGGLFMLFDGKTSFAWMPSQKDERPRVAAIIVLLAQGAAFVGLRRAGGQYPAGLLALATFAALAHGAMSGDDAQNALPRPVIDPQDELVLSPEERSVLASIGADTRDFFVGNRLFLAAIAAGVVALAVFGGVP